MPHRTTDKLLSAISSTFLYRLMTPRNTHLYGIGTAKSGTHSIEAVFGDQLRSAHEPENIKIIDIILDHAAGRIDDTELCHYVLKRDRRLWLDMDSSQLNFFLLDQLVELFSDARFILTIRNPYSWLDSFINHQLAYKDISHKWIQLRDLRFRPDLYTHHAEELILKENGLYTLDGYLSYWAHHNQTVIDTIPENRLLIIRTDKISQHIEEIAAFAGISKSNLKQENSHTFKAKEKFHLLDKLDQEYLEQKVNEHCGDLMLEYFPEIHSKSDELSFGTQ